MENASVNGYEAQGVLYKELPYTVYPSDEITIFVNTDDDYNGAHEYLFKTTTGKNGGKTEYLNEYEALQFVQKKDDGTIYAGVQDEQIIYILLDRIKKLNNKFPSVYNDKVIRGLKTALEGCEERVKDRLERGVLDELKK